jgi:glycopeptide antibiotics resistance protein
LNLAKLILVTPCLPHVPNKMKVKKLHTFANITIVAIEFVFFLTNFQFEEVFDTNRVWV